MKIFTFLFSLSFLIICGQALTQINNYNQIKTITNPETGMQVLRASGENSLQPGPNSFDNQTKDVDINWQFSDAAAIGSKIQVSSQTSQTFMSWWLNNERISLYGNSSTPVWENPVVTDWEWPIDMTEDGMWAASGYNNVAQVYNTTSSTIYWEVILDGTVFGIKLNPEGTQLFVATNFAGNSYLSSFTVGTTTPDWEVMFTGDGTVFTASDDASKLVLCQYSGVNKMWVIDGVNGNVLFDAFYKNQLAPGLSYDGDVIVNGDYSGNVHVYYFDETNNTYYEKWDYKVGGGGTSAWVLGMSVSGDGNTIAVGTLVFLTGGGYDGEMYVFNSWSPTPLWVYTNTGDEVCSIDMSYDGSLIAAASWGPLDHSKPDFYLFRKESDDPILSINTAGSFNSVDISSDGTLCAVTGKAVHNREFGSGGILYNVDSNPDGGLVSGLIDLENTTDNSNAKVVVNELDNYFAYSNNEGAYELKYIPAGTYSITASKIGYYPETINNVEILEGETTILDISLTETGNPPYWLNATQGAGLTVGLTWTCDDPQNFNGFNLYRKNIEEDLFPDEPIATFPNDIFNYEDTNIIPLTTYYYAVTAIIEPGIESPYSNISEGWMSSGFITNEISAFTGTAPVIDGVISAGEWDDAFLLDASDFLGRYDNVSNPVGSVPMYYKVNDDMTELYVACINFNDTVLEDHDEVALYIDDNNDKSYPVPDDLTEGNYWAAYYASGSEIKYRPIYNTGGTGDIILLENPQIAVSDATGYIVYEFVIPMGDTEYWEVNPNEDNQSGLFSFTLDDPSAFDGYWPCDNPEIFIPLDYGTISFGVEDEVPPPPTGLSVWWYENEGINIILGWVPPEINDFSHFNIYISENSAPFELLDNTIGRQYFHMASADYIEFVITTVDNSGQESELSEIAIYDFTIGTSEIMDPLSTSIFPNPSQGTFHISLNVLEAGNYSLSIIGLDGSLLSTIFEGNLPIGNADFEWDGTTQSGTPAPNGVYLLRLYGKQMVKTDKLILLNN